MKTLLRLSLKKKTLVGGRTRSGQVSLRTIGHLFLGNFRRRLARVLPDQKYTTFHKSVISSPGSLDRDGSGLGATCKPCLSVSLHGASVQRLRTLNSPILQVALMIPSYLRLQFRSKRCWPCGIYMCTGRNGEIEFIEFLFSSSNPPMIGVPNWTHAHMGMDQSPLIPYFGGMKIYLPTALAFARAGF